MIPPSSKYASFEVGFYITLTLPTIPQDTVESVKFLGF